MVHYQLMQDQIITARVKLRRMDNDSLISIESNEKSELLNLARVRLIRHYMKMSRIPAMILDNELDILWLNTSASELFVENIDSKALPDLLLESGLGASISNLRKSLSSADYSWFGEMVIKHRERASIRTNLLVSPILEGNKPIAFQVQFDNISQQYDGLLKTIFTTLLDASMLKDNDTGKHIQRVNEYSYRLAREIKDDTRFQEVDFEFLDNIRYLAAFHDVGKIGTPDSILNKRGPLNEAEWNIMREHTLNGGFILSSYPDSMARDIALQHHERFDGRGYPSGLMGNMIRLSARIVAIADVYDALRMKRSYKEAFTHEKSCELIIKDAGTHFDPLLVRFFEKIQSDFDDIYQSLQD
jgi:HD-GYP domain-containing protein (c-di-GMP phosphodiesterase class II)